jgi:hypothetical protein
MQIDEDTMTEELSGRVLAVLIARGTDHIRSELLDEVDVTLEGFIGDKHSGWTKPSDGRTKFYPRGTTIRNSRQVSIISQEETSAIAADLGLKSILPEWMGANLLLKGIQDLSVLKPNSRMFFESGAVLLITEKNNPCSTLSTEIGSHYPDKPELKERIVKCSLGRRGVVAVVELSGKIKKGDTVRVISAQ